MSQLVVSTLLLLGLSLPPLRAPGRGASRQGPAAAAETYASRLALLAAAVQNPATRPETLQQARRQLAQLASQQPAATGWLPLYYQAYGSIRLAFLAAPDAARQDAHLDQAQHALTQAQTALTQTPPAADAAELLVLQAYLYQARLTVAPMRRALRYSSLTTSALNHARQLAPGNPRLYYVLGNDSYYKPRLLGGGVGAAETSYARAQACFTTFRPATAASPTWGETQTQAALARCRRKLAP